MSLFNAFLLVFGLCCCMIAGGAEFTRGNEFTASLLTSIGVVDAVVIMLTLVRPLRK